MNSNIMNIGTNWMLKTTSYANLFMAKLETELTQNFLQSILLWRRFIDDIFFIWTGDQESLQSFMDFCNNFHPTIKFTFETSPISANYLDLHIYLDNLRCLQTTIFRKPADKHLILHFDSNHPFHIKRNTIYGEALRYKRNISNLHYLEKELKFLKRIFRVRGYPRNLIDREIHRGIQIPRSFLLKPKPTTKTTPNHLRTSRRIFFKIPPTHQGD